MTDPRASIDQADVDRFDRLGERWWALDGPMKALHAFNPVRVAYLRDLLRDELQGPDHPAHAAPLAGLSILDIGCGAGILSEPLARLGATMTGIDPAPQNIEVAQRHAADMGLSIDYRAQTAEALQAQGETFDAVLAMEVVEHVRHPRAFLKVAGGLVRPGGVLAAATLNRTLKSYALAIIGAEYVLGWVERGTHRWEQFITPDELRRAFRGAGVTPLDEAGVVYDLFRNSWKRSDDMDVNYMMAGRKRAV